MGVGTSTEEDEEEENEKGSQKSEEFNVRNASLSKNIDSKQLGQ